MRFRLGKLLKGLGTAASVAADLSTSLRNNQVPVPQDVDAALQRLRQFDAVATLGAESEGIKALDAFFDRAQEGRLKVVLQAVADDGEVLHAVELSDLARSSIDQFFDQLERL